MSRRNERRLGLAALGVVLLGAGGCDDYLDRRDTITLGVGDAVAVNKATQTINRWPAAARKDRWLSDGERARAAAHRYRTGTIKNPASLSDTQQAAVPEATDNGTSATTGK